MPDPNHDRLRQLFDRAIELPTSARGAFIDAECGGNAQLKQRLTAMLAAAEDEHFLASPTGSKPVVLTDTEIGAVAPLREGPGTRIGRYKLLQLIGEGGFGAVFLAEQEKPVARRVALKIIKLGMDTRQVVARFEQERQALSMMDHPNIARVLDAGATETGRPYFVMDLVKGDPIAKYCDKNNLTIDERLELFAQVCSAVQHAHTKGIIHRDLKPSNILVGTQDGRPQTKVIDFGIAKATSSKLTDKTLFTEHLQIIGTLQYMSPEQAEGSLDIDTRTDVYSLGVLLYELLTGSTPFDKNTIKDAMFSEIHRMIREVDPPKPSTRLSDSHDTLASIAAHRRVAPKRLGTLIRGELDWIVMKAIEKDRARRYETANGLAMDIRRYLSGELVVAAPPSASYRFRKFVSRNRGPVIAGAAVTAALLVGVVGFAWQASVARGERDNAVLSQKAEADQRRVADEQRDRAVTAEGETRRRADELKLVSEFQAGMLAQVDPTEAGKLLTADVKAKFEETLVKAGVPEAERAAQVDAFAAQWKRVNATDAARELIDRTILRPAVETIEKQFTSQPVVEAQLRQSLADRYREMGLLAAALPLQQQALATRRRVLGEEHPDTLVSINNLGILLDSQGKLSEAEPYLREALEKFRRVLGEEHLNTLTAINNLGNLLQGQGKLSEAEPYVREALEKRRRVLGDAHPDTLTSISNLGNLLHGQGKLSEAEPYVREALEKSRRVLGDEHPNTLTSINNLGNLLHAEGKLGEAELCLREALEKFRRVLGDGHPDTLSSIGNLGALLQDEGKLSEAEPYVREALEKSRRVLGDEHPNTLTSISNLGNLLHAEGKLGEAELCLREALEKFRRVLGDGHPSTLNSINNLGSLLQDQGKLSEAEPYLREALEKSRRLLGDDHPSTLASINNLGSLFQDQGKLGEAEPYLRDALEKFRRVLGDGHPGTLASISNLGSLLQHQGKLGEAEPYYREALEKRRRALGEEHAVTLISISNMGGLLQAQGKLAEAESYYREALEKKRRVLGEEHPDTLLSLYNLADLLIQSGQHAEALPFVEACIGGDTRRFGPAHETSGRALGMAVRLYASWDKAEPGKGYDAKVAEWTAKLAASKSAAPTATPVDVK